MTHILFDLVTEILCRLPAKFLVQFGCVCKSWNSLISKDLEFAKKYLRMSTTKRKHLVTCTWIRSKDEFSMMSYPLDSLQLHSIFTSEPTLLEYYSPIPPDSYKTVVASCDGLLCMSINNRHAVLYNPSIRKLKKLPSLDIPPHIFGYTTFAFGYDPFIDNYKVVSAFSHYCESDGTWVFKTHVNVYTLGIPSWRRIQDFPSMTPNGKSGIIVSGTVNWFASSNVPGNLSRAIVSLDLGKECYQEISEPNYDGMPVYFTLGMIRDCLCICSHSNSFNDVWLMKEYGSKESWIKLIHLPYFGDHGYYVYRPKIVCISEDDNHVLLFQDDVPKWNWVVYDSKNDTIIRLKTQNDLCRVESKVYVESLISP
ncbi:putative F-box domain, leucine-rich repeat domain, L domain-containing protein [Medicago truncatula]|uniref:F-box protein interaction domain protein n=1 Tax=Medicago truncatula TaxID=3880 RepID=A0A072VIP5_MEDTR|nr:F-box/kelch-repeat protein At3g23880 [Medicago truncatula]KEH41859.1 F-box protein interaction domain protein [Medicago truncatula]RHN79395.1 putative F-box domain, leucine-rich repeat domain, L domain-containing protein [Medicago truncatula]